MPFINLGLLVRFQREIQLQLCTQYLMLVSIQEDCWSIPGAGYTLSLGLGELLLMEQGSPMR